VWRTGETAEGREELEEGQRSVRRWMECGEGPVGMIEGGSVGRRDYRSIVSGVLAPGALYPSFRSATIETDFEMGYLQSKLIYDLCVSTGSCAPRVRISPCSSSTLLEGTSRVQGKAWSSVTYCSAAPAGPSPWVYRGVLGAYHHHRRAHRAFVSGLWGAVLWYCVASQVV
jgi:hypothetical protein